MRNEGEGTPAGHAQNPIRDSEGAGRPKVEVALISQNHPISAYLHSNIRVSRPGYLEVSLNFLVDTLEISIDFGRTCREWLPAWQSDRYDGLPRAEAEAEAEDVLSSPPPLYRCLQHPRCTGLSVREDCDCASPRKDVS